MEGVRLVGAGIEVLHQKLGSPPVGSWGKAPVEGLEDEVRRS